MKSASTFIDLSLQQLISFQLVCRLGSYAAAARELYLTTPAVWEQIRLLERYFGAKLFERSGNGVKPTRSGEQLLRIVSPTLTSLESARALLQQASGASPEKLTLATNLRVFAAEISSAIRDFQTRYANCKIDLRFTGGEEIAQLVDSRDADVVLTLDPILSHPLNSTSIVYSPIANVDFLLVAPKNHPLLRKRVLQFKALRDYPLVLGNSSTFSRARVEEVFRRYGIYKDIRIGVETNSDEYTIQCVRANAGVGITMGTPKSNIFEGLAVRQLRRWFGQADMGFLSKRGAQPIEVQKELMELLRGKLS